MSIHNRADWNVNNLDLFPARQETGDAAGFFTPARAVDPRSGTRSSALTGYFEPNANRKNLVVLTGAEATRVLFKSGGQDKKAPRVAEAVEFVSKGNTYKVYAKKEVIVSAGMVAQGWPVVDDDLTHDFFQARSRHHSFWSSLGSVIGDC